MVYPPNLPGVPYLDPTTMQVTTALSSSMGGGYQQQQQQQQLSLNQQQQQQQQMSQHTTTTMYLPTSSSAVMTSSSSLASTPSPPSTSTVAITAMSGPGPMVPDIFSHSNHGSSNNVATGSSSNALAYPMGMAAYNHHGPSGSSGTGSTISNNTTNNNYAPPYQHSPYSMNGPMMMDTSLRGGASAGGGNGGGGGSGGVSAQMMYDASSVPSHGSGNAASGMRMMMMPPTGQGGMNLSRGMNPFPSHTGQSPPQQYSQADHFASQQQQQQQQQLGGLSDAAYQPPTARNNLQNAANASSGGGAGAGPSNTPSVAVDEEVSENAQMIRICIDMPGVQSKDLKVQLRNNGVLEVRAIRRRTGLDGTTVIRKHKIARRYAIDAKTVDVNRVVADLALGVLVITAPKVGSQPPPGPGMATSHPVASPAPTASPRSATTTPTHPSNPRGLGSSTHSTSRYKRTAAALAPPPTDATTFHVSTTSAAPFVRASKRVSTDHSPSEAPGPRDGQDTNSGTPAGQNDSSSGEAGSTTKGKTSLANRKGVRGDGGGGVPMLAAAAQAAAAAAAAAVAAQPEGASRKQQVDEDDDGGEDDDEGDDDDEEEGEEAASTGPVSRRVSVTP